MRLAVAFGILLAVCGGRTAEAACKGRPTDPGGYAGYDYAGGEARSFAGPLARVHWVTAGPHAPVLASTRSDGVPDSVVLASSLAEDALGRYAAMGYPPVPSDAACPSNGDDAKVDLYLVKFGGADGSTVAECTGTTCSSFVLVESTFAGKGYADVTEGFTTVVSHELFHAVQNTYKTDDAPFWAEGTAQWAMKTLHPELQDFERQLPAFFMDPARSFDAPPTGVTAGYLYGAAVWPLFLSLRHGPEIIREIYEVEATGPGALAATEAVLQKKRSSLGEESPLFAAWNVGTGAVASIGGYPDAAKYPGVTTAPLVDGAAGITSGLGSYAYRGTLAIPRQVVLDTDRTRNGAILVPIEDGVLRLDRAAALPVAAEGEVLVVVAGITTNKSDAPFRLALADPAAEDGPAMPPGTSSDGGCAVPRVPSGTPPSGLVLVALGLALAVALRSRTCA